MGIYGKNVVTTVGDEWKLNRKITSRAFSVKNLHLVHAEMTRQVSQMMASWEIATHNGQVVIEQYIPVSSS